MWVDLAEPTDPATDPNWGQSAANVWVDVDDDGVDDVQINYGAFDEGPRVSVIDLHAGVQRCLPLATGHDGTSLRFVHVPPSCLDAPDTVRLRAGMSYGDAEQGSPRFEDLAPGEGHGPPIARQRTGGTVVLAGDDPVAAAVAVARATVPDGGAPTALLARADDFADALASGPLQGLLVAPLLLTPSDHLAGEVAAELDRLGTRTVFVLGGEAAVAPAVVAELLATGRSVERLAGPTRLETAAGIALDWFEATDAALLARAFPAADATQAFADALAAGAWGAAARWPVLLSESDRLSATTGDAIGLLQPTSLHLVGGTAALDEPVAAAAAALGPTVARVAGEERAATAAAIATARGLAGPAAATRVVLLDGTAPDGWAPGFAVALHAASVGDVAVLLTAGDDLPAATRAWLDQPAGVAPTLVCAPLVAAAASEAAAALLPADPPVDP